jgi:uncharacterized protein YigA (DUF484 family)
LLATLRVPHPHDGRTISLQERQLELVRGKLRTCEAQFTELVRTGRENEDLARKLDDWACRLLRVTEMRDLPGAVSGGLETVFSVPQVALQLWRLDDAWAGLECARLVSADVVALADSLEQPHCGPNRGFEVVNRLPGAGVDTQSIALLPLRVPEDAATFGLIVLGSPDPERFRSGMGTVFLERISALAAASLSRLMRR